MEKFLKILGIIVLVVIIGIVIIGCASTSILLRDPEGNKIIGSISEKIFIDIGGIQQGLFIRAENPNNPVILFLHGGPGSPLLPVQLHYELHERLEKYYFSGSIHFLKK